MYFPVSQTAQASSGWRGWDIRRRGRRWDRERWGDRRFRAQRFRRQRRQRRRGWGRHHRETPAGETGENGQTSTESREANSGRAQVRKGVGVSSVLCRYVDALIVFFVPFKKLMTSCKKNPQAYCGQKAGLLFHILTWKLNNPTKVTIRQTFKGIFYWHFFHLLPNYFFCFLNYMLLMILYKKSTELIFLKKTLKGSCEKE